MSTIASNRRVAVNVLAVTPSDTVNMTHKADGGLYVTVTGNVSFICGGVTVALTAVAANTHLPFAATRVLATGTTGTVVALY